MFTYRKMVQNLCWATGYNIATIPQEAGVVAAVSTLLRPAVKTILLSLSAVTVAVNARYL